MITEDYCSFELSKLLKENGFKQEGCHKSYSMEGPVAPTHQMAMKWLREEHKIFIEVSVCIDTNGDYHYHSMALDKICEYILPSIGTYDTYEEAVEAALKYVLEKFELSTEEYNSYEK